MPQRPQNFMTDAQTIAFHHRATRWWLLAVAALIFVTVLVGGATRLTESGLSIVEWHPVTGILPPISDAEWDVEFQKYRTIPQYRERNPGISVGAFKIIYWWEWTHRLLGRLIGAAFLLPFLWFLWRGWIEPRFRARLWIIFGLGALQGAVGWWMVMSGLTKRVSVAHERLAFHLTLACIIYATILWVAQRSREPAPAPTSVRARVRNEAIGILVLVFVQIFFGALVAGLRGGLIYNTWPLIDGVLVPPAERLLFLAPALDNFFDNVLTVQFTHRVIADVLWVAAMAHLIKAVVRREEVAIDGALTLAIAITIQAAFGIVTLLYQAPIALSLAHQGIAMVVLTIAVVHAELLTVRKLDARIAVMPSSSQT
jgi:cytochrome c oxidase assembly protein subunit 15